MGSMTIIKAARRTCRRLARDTRATEIAEAAVVLPLLFMILMGIFWFGQAFRIYGTLTQATRAGARAAVAPVCATCAAAATSPGLIAQTAVQNSMAAAHLSPNDLVTTGAAWTTPAPTLYQCHTNPLTPVACDGTVTSVCVQENVQLSFPAPATGPAGMGECGTSVSVRYKYPFHFSIPFTNLDLGNIQLPGQAEMRAETQ
jgi:Flp pilus assembly protein TadG